MTVKELIEQLKIVNQDAEVTAYDGDTETYEPVTGIIYSEDNVELQTDPIAEP